MNLSDKGKEFLKHHEGYRERVYADGAGYATIGYGHKLGKYETFTLIDKDQADLLFNRDASIAESVVNTLVKVKLTQNQFDALVSFVFNLGGNAFYKSTLLKKLNNKEFDKAANEFLRWNKIKVNGVYEVSKGISARREAEKQLFLGT